MKTASLSIMAEGGAPARDADRNGASAAIARRFWALLLLVLALAVTSSAFAVRYTATPFLANQQREAVIDQAEKHARNLDSILSRRRLLLSFVAGDSKVYDVVMGYSENTGIVGDHLESLQQPEALDWVALYDIFGEPLSRRRVRDDDLAFFGESELLALVRGYETGARGAAQRVLLRVDDEHVHIVLAAPVGHGGFVEGVLVGGFTIDPAEVFPESEIAKSTYVVKRSHVKYLTNVGPEGAIVVPLDEFDLAVVMTPDRAAAAAAGRSLVTATVSAMVMAKMPAPSTAPCLISLACLAHFFDFFLMSWSFMKMPIRLSATGVLATFTNPLCSIFRASSRLLPAPFWITLTASTGAG